MVWSHSFEVTTTEKKRSAAGGDRGRCAGSKRDRRDRRDTASKPTAPA